MAFIEERLTMDSEEIRVIMFMDSEEIRVRRTLDFEEIRVTSLLIIPTCRHSEGIFARTRPPIGHGDPRSPRPHPQLLQPQPLACVPLPQPGL